MREEQFFNLLNSVYTKDRTELHTTETIIHNEGDIWDEDGKKWTIEDGVIISLSDTDDIRNDINVPYFCPKCKGSMGKDLDTKFYYTKGMCMKCVIEEETTLRIEGKYKKYEKQQVNRNLIFKLEQAKDEIEDFKFSNDILLTDELGNVEEWAGNIDKNAVVSDLEETIEKLRKKIK